MRGEGKAIRFAGVAGLDLTYLVAGTALLYGLGLVRSARAGLRYAGLAVLVGWAAVGLLSAFALMAGASLPLRELVAIAVLVASAGLAAGRRVQPLRRARRWELSSGGLALAVAGGAVLAVYLAELGRRARLSAPAAWDSWGFWVPKAETIVYSGGLHGGPGAFTSFANPDYPPLVATLDATVFRFSRVVDPTLLPLQHWVLVTALFAALAALLWERVSPAILLPSLAALALLPNFSTLAGSLLGDEALAIAIALAAVSAALWLLEREPRYLVLFALFAAALSLTKNEGFTDALLLSALVVVGSLRTGRFRLAAPVLAAPLAAMLPWKLWLHVHDVPPNGYYRFSDLLRPGYLADRADRLGTSLADLPAYYFSYGRWLVVVPVALVLAVLLARRRPRLTLLVVGTVVVAFLGNVAVYWISSAPLHWYITTSADRTSTGPAVFSAALVPLLAAEALGESRARPGLGLRRLLAGAWERALARRAAGW